MKPKTLCYSYAIGHLPEEEQRKLAMCDLLVTADRPEIFAKFRRWNPDLKIMWCGLPQHVAPWDPRWENDISWSPRRAWQSMCHEHDFYLRTTRGDVINDGVHNIVNWTPYSEAAVSWVGMYSSFATKQKWGWENSKPDGINGLVIEVMFDCLGSLEVPGLEIADPDSDGIAEGVSKMCSLGGNNEPLSVLMRVSNWRVRKAILEWPDRFPVVMNDGAYHAGPSWALRPGPIKIKQENWLFKVARALNPEVEYRRQIANVKPFCYYHYGTEGTQPNLERLCVATAMMKDVYCGLQNHPGRITWRIPEMDYEMGKAVSTVTTQGLIMLVYENGTITIDPKNLDATWGMKFRAKARETEKESTDAVPGDQDGPKDRVHDPS